MRGSLFYSLRQGGFILYVRHGEATIGEDLPNLNFTNCYTQRNLSQRGKMQAVYYGEILHHLNIPVSYHVIASPFCRTIETAQLAFGYENVMIDPFWIEIYRLGGNLSGEEKEGILDRLRSVLEIKPLEGWNKVIIAHSFPAGMGLGQIPNMGTVIVKPGGQGMGYEIVSRLSLADLSTLGNME